MVRGYVRVAECEMEEVEVAGRRDGAQIGKREGRDDRRVRNLD